MEKGSQVGKKSFIFNFFLTPTDKSANKKTPATARQVALAAVLTALAVVLGSLSIPVGATKVAPSQHMINAIAGVLLGPWYAVLMAFITATIRIGLGVGTIFAYPGSVFGGLVVGIVYKYIKKTDYAVLLEPLGTVVIGATLSAWVFAPYIGSSLTISFFWIAFGASCIPGAILGFLILKVIRRSGFDKYFV